MSLNNPRYHYVFGDVLIVGGGIAGLATALSLDPRLQVTVVTKTQVKSSNTYDAQGGIAVSVGEDDSFDSHVQDTLTAGCELCDDEAVRKIIECSHEALDKLIRWGARFDDSLGLEGGHSRHRILHAEGARTGREIARSLTAELEKRDNIQLLQNHFVVDLLLEDGRVAGALLQADNGQACVFRTQQVVMATGGLGQVYRETSNPTVATGDGVALAQRAGATLMDMEFVQFHPTTLYIAGAARVLISEAVRGAGGQLIDGTGRRIMVGRHERAELAPRDVVSRVVLETIKSTRDTQVYLDVRHLGDFDKKFPSLHQTCLDFGVDSSSDPIPVCPSAHYHIGGIKTDLMGRTSIEGLTAAGECASTGLHGANRLASNSLLEGLVMGGEVAKVLNDKTYQVKVGPVNTPLNGNKPFNVDIGDLRRSLRNMMWKQVGIVRHAKGLSMAKSSIDRWLHVLEDRHMNQVAQWELHNMMQVSLAMVSSALKREESRGVHYRSDFPESLDDWNLHIEMVSEGET